MRDNASIMFLEDDTSMDGSTDTFFRIRFNDLAMDEKLLQILGFHVMPDSPSQFISFITAFSTIRRDKKEKMLSLNPIISVVIQKKDLMEKIQKHLAELRNENMLYFKNEHIIVCDKRYDHWSPHFKRDFPDGMSDFSEGTVIRFDNLLKRTGYLASLGITNELNALLSEPKYLNRFKGCDLLYLSVKVMTKKPFGVF